MAAVTSAFEPSLRGQSTGSDYLCDCRSRAVSRGARRLCDSGLARHPCRSDHGVTDGVGRSYLPKPSLGWAEKVRIGAGSSSSSTTRTGSFRGESQTRPANRSSLVAVERSGEEIRTSCQPHPAQEHRADRAGVHDVVGRPMQRSVCYFRWRADHYFGWRAVHAPFGNIG